MAIQMIVPVAQSGGVFDFVCKLQGRFDDDEVQLMPLSRAGIANWQVGSSDTVILQMSAYGFDRRGLPWWLLREIESRRESMTTFAVFFHELYAFGPPWSSAFWVSPLQRHIARRLAELSDFWMTSREGSAAWLARYAGDTPHAVLPVFSTIGEPQNVVETRERRIIVFGSPALRLATYEAAGNVLFNWAERLDLTIHDVGIPLVDAPLTAALRRNGVIMHGQLPAVEVSALMSNALFGLVAYPANYVAKSSVFAAYCVHGLCPILLSRTYETVDGLAAGNHYLTWPPEKFSLQTCSIVKDAAQHWYAPHSIEAHVAAIRRFSLVPR